MNPVAPNFTVSDLIGISYAIFLFPLFTVVPGYVCGWLLDAFGFRQRSLLARLAISIALSIGISPVLAYLSWHWSIIAVWAVFGTTWVGCIALVFHDRRVWFSRPVVSKGRVAFLGIAVGWVLFGAFSLVDLQFKNRLYFSLVAHDYTFRTAVAAAINRSGIPPYNPYFFPGRPFVLRYHYFWSILCSLISQIGGTRLSPRQAVLAGTVWCGVGLIALVPLYLRFFQPRGTKDLDKRMLIGVALLGVTGLNIVILVLLDLLFRNVLTMPYAIVPWTDQVFWAPHHVTALVACLTGFLLLWSRRGRRGAASDTLTGIAAGITFASGFGLSVYVAFVFAIFLTVWAAMNVVWRRYREVGLICSAGAVALILCIPYVLELLGGVSHAGSATGGPLLQFTIRAFPITDSLVATSDPMKRWLRPVANTLFLPLNYFMELGFFFLIGFYQWRTMRRSKSFLGHAELCGLVMAVSALIVCTFLRSGVIAVNDLGLRGPMFVQFMLLIWGAELLHEGLMARTVSTSEMQPGQVRISPAGRKLLVGTLVLGVAGTIYDLCILRLYPIIADDTNISSLKWVSSDRNLGSRTYALRQLYEGLKDKLPPTAVIQHNPDVDPGELAYGLYADRQTAAETLACGTVFGGDPASCSQIIGRICDLFEKPEAVATDQVDSVCKDLSIDALIAKDTDPVWADKNSWVWKRQPVFASRYARAFVCGGAANFEIPQR